MREMKRYNRTYRRYFSNQTPSQKIKTDRLIFKSFPKDVSYSDKLKIKRRAYFPKKAPKGYGFISILNKITQKRLLGKPKGRYLMRFKRFGSE